MNKISSENVYTDLSFKSRAVIDSVNSSLEKASIHTIDFLSKKSCTNDVPFYVQSRLSFHSPYSYSTLLTYIAYINSELSFILSHTSSPLSETSCMLIKNFQSLKLSIQSFVADIESLLNDCFLDRLIMSNDPISLLICREKLKYYKVMSYMDLKTDCAIEYIQKIEAVISQKYGQEAIAYFDLKKEKLIGFDVQFGDDFLSFDLCIALWKNKFITQKNI